MADPIERPGRSRSGRTRLVAAVTAIAAAVALTASSCVLNGAWAATAPAAAGPPGIGASFVDVSCPTEDFCMALGAVAIPLVTVPDPPGTYVISSSPIVQTWDGSVWTQIPFETVTPYPELHGVQVHSVSCGTPTVCAIQWDVRFDDERVPKFSVWDGTSWTVGQVPYDGAEEALVACGSDGSCLYMSSGTPTVVWDGSSFEAYTYDDDGVISPPLTALACSSATSCTGTTIYDTSSAWNGSSWSPHPGPALPVATSGAPTTWTSISCPTPANCIATGSSNDPVPGAPDAPIAARFDGRSWTAAALPITAGRIADLSCASTIACVAIATESVGSPATDQPVTLAWNGGQWYRATDPPLPAGATYHSIGCGAGDLCMAVGTVTTGGVASPLASTYAWEAAT